MAAQLGAKRVIAIEANPDLVTPSPSLCDTITATM
jgi:hypothetical protein